MRISDWSSDVCSSDLATQWMLQQYGRVWQAHHLWAMPVVAETYDGVLNDINGLHVTAEHAVNAIHAAAAGPVAEGNVDRKSVVWGKSVSVSVKHGGGRIIKKKKRSYERVVRNK